MMNHFKLIPFVVGLIIGIIGILFIQQDKEVTYRYPTPDDNGKTIYKDKNGVCYRYKATEVDCDKNESKIKPFPLSR